MATRRVLVIGAHPDDCDVKAGGSAILWKRRGHDVRFVSMTCGDAGHHEMSGEKLAERRRAEAKGAAELIGIEYDVLDHHDGQLQVTLENRFEVVRLIREYKPDLVLTHRPNDYHPDHRYTAQLVQDAAYMVTVPPIAPETPFLPRNPVFGYLSDSFTRPYPFTPDAFVPIDSVIETVIEMLACHESQVFEWLPFNQGVSDRVPADKAGRRKFLLEWYTHRFAKLADRYRPEIVGAFGPERGAKLLYVEAFEISEYGSALSDELREDLFAGF